MYKYIIRQKESGIQIDAANTPTEAQNMLIIFEHDDKMEGIYEPDFYELAVWDEAEERYIPYTYQSKVRTARIKAGMSQSQLAEASGCSHRTIQNWENAYRIPRDVYVLRDVAKALGCHIEDLID